MKKFYAEQATMGRDIKTQLVFDSKKERDDYVANTDYSNTISAKDVAQESVMTVSEFKNSY